MDKFKKVLQKMIVQGDCKIDYIMESIKEVCQETYSEDNLPTIKQYMQDALSNCFKEDNNFIMDRAEESRKVSEDINTKLTRDCLEDVKACIINARERGHNSCYYYKSLPHIPKKYLEQMGYLVYSTNNRNEIMHQISW